MQAILYVGHGTRLKKGVDEVIEFIEKTKKHLHIPIQEISFLELVKPTIFEGITKCVERGATSISIAPILLLEAQHAKIDIPHEIEKAREIYPNINFAISKPFGLHESLIDEIFNQIKVIDLKISYDAEVLLIARGSSDPSVVSEMKKIVERFKEKYHFNNVNACFLYGNGPSFDDALQDLILRQPKKVYIVPYLLFSGLLKKSIESKMKGLETGNSKFVLCESLGYGENVRQVLLERILETIV